MNAPELSVILPVEPGVDPAPALEALGRTLAHLSAEILVVGDVPPSAPPASARFVAADATRLVPELWALGLAEARGDVVAFTTARCVVASGWADALLYAIGRGAAGVGGPIGLAPGAGVAAVAAHLVRFSGFLPPLAAGPVHHVAGDNAAYPRRLLERHAATLADGFWEVEFHERIRGDGALLVVPDAAAEVRSAPNLFDLAKHRFRHARHFAAWRVGTGRGSRARTLFATPLVPLVLTRRILARAWSRPGLRLRALAATPAILVLSAFWAVGEAAGALAPPGADAARPRIPHPAVPR